MDNLDSLLNVFARSIHAKATSLQNAPLNKHQRDRINESISDDLKKCSDLIPVDVSAAAEAEANRLNLDLRSQGWHDQRKFDPGRKIFHREHKDTISDIREECCVQTTESEIFNLLKKRLSVVWILKSEDKELTRLGYRHHRPDTNVAYQRAGIQLTPRKPGPEQH